ncbi:hypothetical protein JHK85_002372 [Glycine max]|nr:hypothetical protein JHK85_002372 [Glycine max]
MESMKKKLKLRTLKHDDHLNSPKEIEANKNSNGFDTPFVQKSSVVSPPSPVVVSNGQKHLTNDNSLDNVGKRQQRRFSFGEPKVILDVPSPAEDVYRVSDFESEIKKHVNRTVPLVWDGCNVSKWKRGRGNFGIGDPLQDTLKDKKLRSEDNQ